MPPPSGRRAECRGTRQTRRQFMTNIHPLLPQDAAAVAMMRQAASTHKGEVLGPEARPIFYAMLAATSSAAGIRVEPVAVGGITGSWLRTERRSLRHGCFTCMAMISRVLDGADIPAAEEAFALLIARVAAIADEGLLSEQSMWLPISCGRLRTRDRFFMSPRGYASCRRPPLPSSRKSPRGLCGPS